MRVVPDLPGAGAVANGGCYLCGIGPRAKRGGGYEAMLDCERIIEFEGHLFLCQSCVLDAAAMFGCLAPEPTERLRADLEQAVIDRDRLQTLVDQDGELRELLERVNVGLEQRAQENGAAIEQLTEAKKPEAPVEIDPELAAETLERING